MSRINRKLLAKAGIEERRFHDLRHTFATMEKIGGFMETATDKPEPPDPPEESRCKVIPFERAG